MSEINFEFLSQKSEELSKKAGTFARGSRSFNPEVGVEYKLLFFPPVEKVDGKFKIFGADGKSFIYEYKVHQSSEGGKYGQSTPDTRTTRGETDKVSNAIAHGASITGYSLKSKSAFRLVVLEPQPREFKKEDGTVEKAFVLSEDEELKGMRVMNAGKMFAQVFIDALIAYFTIRQSMGHPMTMDIKSLPPASFKKTGTGLNTKFTLTFLHQPAKVLAGVVNFSYEKDGEEKFVFEGSDPKERLQSFMHYLCTSAAAEVYHPNDEQIEAFIRNEDMRKYSKKNRGTEVKKSSGPTDFSHVTDEEIPF